MIYESMRLQVIFLSTSIITSPGLRNLPRKSVAGKQVPQNRESLWPCYLGIGRKQHQQILQLKTRWKTSQMVRKKTVCFQDGKHVSDIQTDKSSMGSCDSSLASMNAEQRPFVSTTRKLAKPMWTTFKRQMAVRGFNRGKVATCLAFGKNLSNQSFLAIPFFTCEQVYID